MKLKKVLVISGPNLNMLEHRDKKIYGGKSLQDLEVMLKNQFKQIDFDFFQSNHEGAIVDKLQAASNYDALLINAAAYTHTSIAIRDALEMLHILKVEVHLSDFTRREPFRNISLLTDVCNMVFYGKQFQSYVDALNYVCTTLNNPL